MVHVSSSMVLDIVIMRFKLTPEGVVVHLQLLFAYEIACACLHVHYHYRVLMCLCVPRIVVQQTSGTCRCGF